MLKRGVNPFVVDYDGETQYDYFHNNFAHVPKHMLQKYSNKMSSTAIYYSTHEIKCDINCPAKCPDQMCAFEMKTGIKFTRTRSKDIGKGGDGVVYRGKWHDKDAAFKHVITKTPVKKCSVTSLTDDQNLSTAETKRTDTLAKQIRIHQDNEFVFHSTLIHKHILPVYDFYRQQIEGINYLVIVSKLCEMDLSEYLRDHQFDFDVLKQLFLQAVNGLKVIAAAGLSHGDIKPDNFLLKSVSRGSTSSTFRGLKWQPADWPHRFFFPCESEEARELC